MIGQYVVVRSVEAGVFCGILVKCTAGHIVTVELKDSSNIWEWSGANTLCEVALHGVSQTSKISEKVDVQQIIGVCQIIACTKKAQKNLSKPRW